jgi:3-oxoacyl-[acyl-carrier-protein] synthase-3
MVTLVQDKLGLQRCAAVEIRSGCAGTMEALDLARMYLERGGYRTALVIGSEAISSLLVPAFLGKDPADLRMRDRVMYYNFGDGAGAMLLQADEQGEGILGSAMACVGGGKKPGMQIVGGTYAPLQKQKQSERFMSFQVDVVEAGRFSPFVIAEALNAILSSSGASADSIDHCIVPEGNAGYVLEQLRISGTLTPEWSTLQNKIRENLSRVGATGSAAVPLALDDTWKSGQLKAGERVMLVGIETSKWIYAGMVLPWTAEAYSALSQRAQGAVSGTPS